MKKLFLTAMLLSCAVLLSGQGNKYKPLSEFGGDTLSYMTYNFIENKARYVGQPFERLFNEWGIGLGDTSFKFVPTNWPAGNVLYVYVYNVWDDITVRVVPEEQVENSKKRFYEMYVVFNPPVPLPMHPGSIEPLTIEIRDPVVKLNKVRSGIVGDMRLTVRHYK